MKFTDIRISVRTFARHMELALRAKDKERGSDGWLNDDYLPLFDRLKEEVAEVEEILEKIDWDCSPTPYFRERIIKELADVGNFAMMIVDLLETHPTLEQVSCVYCGGVDAHMPGCRG